MSGEVIDVDEVVDTAVKSEESIAMVFNSSRRSKPSDSFWHCNGFRRVKRNNTLLAYCTNCKYFFKNTSKNRLLSHRLKCQQQTHIFVDTNLSEMCSEKQIEFVNVAEAERNGRKQSHSLSGPSECRELKYELPKEEATHAEVNASSSMGSFVGNCLEKMTEWNRMRAISEIHNVLLKYHPDNPENS